MERYDWYAVAGTAVFALAIVVCLVALIVELRRARPERRRRQHPATGQLRIQLRADVAQAAAELRRADRALADLGPSCCPEHATQHGAHR